MTFVRDTGIWHLPPWVMLIMMPIIAWYVWDKLTRQRELAKRHPFVDDDAVVARFQNRQDLTFRLVGLFLALAALSGIIAWLARYRSDRVFVGGALGVIISLALAVYSSAAGSRCPVCDASASTSENFCAACGARLKPRS